MHNDIYFILTCLQVKTIGLNLFRSAVLLAGAFVWLTFANFEVDGTM